MFGSIKPTIARGASLPLVAQQVLAEDPTLRPELANNPGLHPDLWFTLWPVKPKPTADQASGLAARPLNADQRTHVLTNERRAEALIAYLGHNRPDLDEQKTILSIKKLSPKVARYMLDCGLVDESLRAEAIQIAGGEALLWWLAESTPEQVSDTVLVDRLANFSTWGKAIRSTKTRRDAITQIVEQRPHLLGDIVTATADEKVLSAVAGLRHLTDIDHQRLVAGLDADNNLTRPIVDWQWALLALVNNPVCHMEVMTAVDKACGAIDRAGLGYQVEEATDRVHRSISERQSKGRYTVTAPYDTVTDPQTIAWLVSRSTPFQSYDGSVRPGRPWDLAVLAANPHLDDTQTLRVLRSVSGNDMLQVIGWDRQLDALRGLAANASPDTVEVVTERLSEVEAERANHDNEGPSTDDRDRSRPQGEDTQLDPGQVVALTDEDRPQVAEFQLSHLYRGITYVNRALAYWHSELGDNTEAWSTLFGFLETFEGTTGELTQLVQVTTATK